MEVRSVGVCEFQISGLLIYLFVEPSDDFGVVLSFFFRIAENLISKSQLSHSNISFFFADNDGVFRKTGV